MRTMPLITNDPQMEYIPSVDASSKKVEDNSTVFIFISQPSTHVNFGVVAISITKTDGWDPFVSTTSEIKERQENNIYIAELSDEMKKSILRINTFTTLNKDNFIIPSDKVVKDALEFLKLVEFLKLGTPTINPSSKGGISFEFIYRDYYISLEIFNKGTYVLLIQQKKQIHESF